MALEVMVRLVRAAHQPSSTVKSMEVVPALVEDMIYVEIPQLLLLTVNFLKMKQAQMAVPFTLTIPQ